MVDAVSWYDANAEVVAERYERVAPQQVHSWLIDLLPSRPAAILDVGAGSGRDAAWLSTLGYDVVAVEPSAEMRAKAQALHPDVPVRWISDTLPALQRTFKTGLSFDFILLSAVWMHVPPSDRSRAFRKLINLLKPGGVIAVTLRDGPAKRERGIHEVSSVEVETLAREHGAFVERTIGGEDRLGRKEVHWTQIAFRLPDDGTGALPLLRHVILNDDKSSTYKLGLLRTLCRIANGAAGFAREHDEDHVAVPMGLVALNWIRLYKPLLASDLPQSPINHGYDRLGFAKDAFRRLSHVSPQDLRAGVRFSSDIGSTLHQALKDVATTIAKMPATHITYPNGGPILRVIRMGRSGRVSEVRLDEAYLASFGEMLIPIHLWRALQRFNAWIEPALISEWIRLTKFYASRQGRSLEDARISEGMLWSEPIRDVRVAREQAERLLTAGPLHCVWSGRRLSSGDLDVDHCFPWAAWPCADLWNLMPAQRTVNQREKRDRLPSDQILRSAEDRIMTWWRSAYQNSPDSLLGERFTLEAGASLPSIMSSAAALEDVYAAVTLQRMRLKHDQQVPEWGGEGTN
ncbi:MAG: class I SAM-dependent methyltransferase [Proteobacteria bacterium]|nr:class I SAM-dependent methyltransferase [Pseudomonadota bacterium]